jgi:hypothetical protein
VLSRLRESINDATVQRALDGLAAKMASDERARADQAAWALGAQLEAATVMAHFVWWLEQYSKVQEALAAGPAYANHPDEQDLIRQAVARRRAELAAALDGYLRLVRQIATGPAAGEVDRQVAVVRQEMQNRGQRQLSGFLPVLAGHAGAMVRGQAPLRDKALADILAVPPATSR